MKKTRVIAVGLVVSLVVLISGCDMLGKKYTIEVRTSTDQWVSIEYRETGDTAWTDAEMYDSDGNHVSFIAYDDSSYPDHAFFDLPGKGTYDFRATDILGNPVGPARNEIISNCVVEYDNMGMDSAYNLTISTTDTTHGFY